MDGYVGAVSDPALRMQNEWGRARAWESGGRLSGVISEIAIVSFYIVLNPAEKHATHGSQLSSLSDCSLATQRKADYLKMPFLNIPLTA